MKMFDELPVPSFYHKMSTVHLNSSQIDKQLNDFIEATNLDDLRQQQEAGIKKWINKFKEIYFNSLKNCYSNVPSKFNLFIHVLFIK
jgi:hypothetical protein